MYRMWGVNLIKLKRPFDRYLQTDLITALHRRSIRVRTDIDGFHFSSRNFLDALTNGNHLGDSGFVDFDRSKFSRDQNKTTLVAHSVQRVSNSQLKQ